MIIFYQTNRNFITYSIFYYNINNKRKFTQISFLKKAVGKFKLVLRQMRNRIFEMTFTVRNFRNQTRHIFLLRHYEILLVPKIRFRICCSTIYTPS